MLNLSWIKSFYQFDQDPSGPSERMRKVVMTAVGSYGLYSWFCLDQAWPLLFAVMLALLLFLEPINHTFMRITYYVVQSVVQTLKLLIMTTMYFTVFSLYALYFRRKHLAQTSFVIENNSTFKKIDRIEHNWQKMF